MFISLSASYAGNACAVRQSINKYNLSKGETQFFDWLVCSMKSINEILEGKPILFEDNYQNNATTITIKFLNFDKLISHHDLQEYNTANIIEITKKYNRRYERLINIIKNKKNIFFIRYCKNTNDIEEEEILNFYKNINNINNELKFKFILISDCDNLIISDSLKKKIIYINLNNYIDEDILNETNEYYKIIKKYKCVFKYLHPRIKR